MKVRNLLAALGYKALLLLILTAALMSFPPTGRGEQAFKLSIVHMNDPHAHYVPYVENEAEGLIGGFGRAATVIRMILEENRAQGRETYLLLGGDLLTGTPYSTFFKGELGVKLMNLMGFHAMVVGNHEFDQGADHLINTLLPMMKFPLLSANIVGPSGAFPFAKNLVLTHPPSKTRIVIAGLTTDETPVSTHPRNVVGYKFADPVKTACDVLDGVSERDLVIALTHIGVDKDRELARSCPKVDVIVGGHSHTALFEPLKERDTLIVQAGAYARFVGRLDLDVVDGKVVGYRGELIPLSAQVAQDPEVESIIAEYKAKLDAGLGTVVGKTDVHLDGGRSSLRSDRTTNLGLLLAFLTARDQRAQIGLINAGSIRAGLNIGDITPADVYSVLPFSSRPVRLELKGSDLVRVLQKSADMKQGSGGKLQVRGVSYKIENGRVIIEKVGDTVFGPEETYSVAVNDFLAAGGDGYDMLKDKCSGSAVSSILLSDLLMDYIKERGVVTASGIDELR